MGWGEVRDPKEQRGCRIHGCGPDCVGYVESDDADRTIYKYPLDRGLNVIRVPRGARFLSIQVQYDIPCTWWLVDPAADLHEIKLVVIGTGQVHRGLATWKYLGTFQVLGGDYVGHVFWMPS